ncbi:hypothetical protein [Pseudonocardia parietis]|uniref:TolA-binding protein n=1 Tax=Pseudonocardia parietis TaxID=570936 RepID=A0ABS4W264_9PSEU|nr:hypothetical protein [Pseudonocardia parietis]MBP2370203.1 TolA-binding protein [Pseudonocardia parietis]
MADILSLAPVLTGASGAGLLVLFVMYLVKANRDDRLQHRETIAALREEHRREVAGLEGKIDRLEKRIDDLQGLVDTERQARRDAQEEAHRAEVRASIAEQRLAALMQVSGGAHDPATTWFSSPALPAVATRVDEPEPEQVDPGDG